MLGGFAVGVGIGSLACARLLHNQISLRYVAYAGFGVSLFTADFAIGALYAGHLPTAAAMLHSFTGWHMLLDLLILAIFGGVYSVPLYVMVQERSPPSHRARMIAANNVMNAFASVIGAGLTALLYAVGLSGSVILLMFAASNVAVSLWIMWSFEAPSRSCRWSATRSAFAMMVRVGFTAPMEGKKLGVGDVEIVELVRAWQSWCPARMLAGSRAEARGAGLVGGAAQHRNVLAEIEGCGRVEHPLWAPDAGSDRLLQSWRAGVDAPRGPWSCASRAATPMPSGAMVMRFSARGRSSLTTARNPSSAAPSARTACSGSKSSQGQRLGLDLVGMGCGAHLDQAQADSRNRRRSK